MKLETISTKGELTSVKVVTIQHALSKKTLAASSIPVGTVLVKTKQDLAQALAAQLLAGHLARFTIHDDATEEQVLIAVTCYVVPPDKMPNKKASDLAVPEQRIIMPT